MKGPCIRGLATAACKIKCLVLGMATLNLDMVIELMTNFPCLEKLYIQVMIVLPILHFLWLLY